MTSPAPPEAEGPGRQAVASVLGGGVLGAYEACASRGRRWVTMNAG
jgi:hypothetical protein